MSTYLTDILLLNQIEENANTVGKFIERIGGRPTLDKVHKIFYDKIYADPWMKKFFEGINQQHIESQQSDFMMMLFGGPKIYGGRMPKDAHDHIMVTDELFDYRHKLLKDSLLEAQVAQDELEHWLRIDQSFRKVIVKQSVDECKKRYTTDEILDFVKAS